MKPIRSRIAILGVFALVAIILAGSLYSEYWTWRSLKGDSDFPAYFTAALLARGQRSTQIYRDASRASDPTSQLADPNTLFARVAQANGAPTVAFYVYPPTLADLLVPFTFLPARTAYVLWQILNVAALLLSVFLIARMLELRPAGAVIAAILFALLYRPSLATFDLAQVTILLLLLLLAGCASYLAQRHQMAAFLFALAAAIKITPLVILFPLIAWREWKMLRRVILWLGVMALALCVFNGAQAMSLYFFDVVPRMAHRGVDLSDPTLNTALQVLRYGSAQAVPTVWIGWLAKILAVLALGFASWLSRSPGEKQWTATQRFAILSCFLLLSACLAPVSWRHGYVLALPLLMILGQELWQRRATWIEAMLGLWFLGSISNDKIANLARESGSLIYFYLSAITPLLGILLALLELRRLRSGQDKVAAATHEAVATA